MQKDMLMHKRLEEKLKKIKKSSGKSRPMLKHGQIIGILTEALALFDQINLIITDIVKAKAWVRSVYYMLKYSRFILPLHFFHRTQIL